MQGQLHRVLVGTALLWPSLTATLRMSAQAIERQLLGKVSKMLPRTVHPLAEWNLSIPIWS